MTVLVDDVKRKIGKAMICHMIGDDPKELHQIADKIGANRKFFKNGFYSVTTYQRCEAVKAGAIPVTERQLIAMNMRRKETGSYGFAADSEEWLDKHLKEKNERAKKAD